MFHVITYCTGSCCDKKGSECGANKAAFHGGCSLSFGMAEPNKASSPAECDGVELLADPSRHVEIKESDADEDAPLTLRDLLTIALVPALVPALVLLLALAIAFGLGALSPPVRSLFEQIAGGALLITYLKEIFPQVMERLDEMAAALGPTTAATRRAKHRRWFGLMLLVVLTTVVSIVIQAAFEGFPGLKGFFSDTSASSAPCGSGKSGRSTSGEHFTPGDTVPYFLGFFVDGVVLAYVCIEYLERQIDFVLSPQVEAAGNEAGGAARTHVHVHVSSARRWLVRLRAHPVFTGTFAVLLVLMLFALSVFAVIFCMYTVIAAAIDPQRMLAVLLAVVGTIAIARQTYVQLKQMRQRHVDALQDLAKGLAEDSSAVLKMQKTVNGQIAEVLREAGWSSAQITFAMLAWVALAALAFAFVVLGCFFFTSADSIVPSLVSGLVVASSALVSFQSGNVGADSVQQTALTSALTARFGALTSYAGRIETGVQSFAAPVQSAQTASDKLGDALGA